MSGWLPEITWVLCRLCGQGMAIWDLGPHIEGAHGDECFNDKDFKYWTDVFWRSRAHRGYTVERLNREIREDFEALTLPKLDPSGHGKVERLWQHECTGHFVWREECPGEGWRIVPTMHEDELPREMTDTEPGWPERGRMRRISGL